MVIWWIWNGRLLRGCCLVNVVGSFGFCMIIDDIWMVCFMFFGLDVFGVICMSVMESGILFMCVFVVGLNRVFGMFCLRFLLNWGWWMIGSIWLIVLWFVVIFRLWVLKGDLLGGFWLIMWWFYDENLCLSRWLGLFFWFCFDGWGGFGL